MEGGTHMTNDLKAARVLAAVDDLFFWTKIEAAARHLGVRLQHATDAAQFEEKLATEVPDLIILDLNSEACAPMAVLRRVKSDQKLKAIPVVGFLSHVQVELAQSAIAAGCDRVLPRSKFSATLPEILRLAGR